MISDLTIIVPTLNERENIEPLVDRLRRALDGIAWDIMFVEDDSRDGTLDVLHRLARQDERIRYIQRIGRPAYPRPAWQAWQPVPRPTWR